MADWTGVGHDTADVYRRFATREVRGLSPSYDALCLAIASDPVLVALLDELPPPKRQPNLLLAATRYLGGPVDRPPEFLTWAHAHWPELVGVISTRRTQTNEARRCASLLPFLATIGGPLALIEVGSSAGLCLLPDRYRYRYTGVDALVGSGSPELVCHVDGIEPPAAIPRIGWRRGLDLHPLDVTDPDDVRWLRCLVWPEQADRLEVLARAVETARADPPTIRAGDLLTDLERLVDDVPPDHTAVVFHTAVLAYLGPDDRFRFESTMRRLASERGVRWISNEAPGVVSGTVPDGTTRFVVCLDGVPVARTSPHGDTLTRV